MSVKSSSLPQNMSQDEKLLRMSKGQRFLHNFCQFFLGIPKKIAGWAIGIGKFFKNFGIKIYLACKDIVMTFVHGSWITRVSYLIMGFGSFARKQILRGILFLGAEVVFIWYMISTGGYYIGALNTLGTKQPIENIELGTVVYGDNSFKILLYGVLSIFFIIAFIYTWYVNVKQNRINEEILKEKKRISTSGDDLRSLVDKNFHKTLLALPTVGIIVFTVLPIIFMILVAFTNYSSHHNGYTNSLFGWQGFDNFKQILAWNSGGKNYSATFGEILVWTLIWAFFATFTNYFLGMMVAMLINKKGIKLKKVWRTVLVLSIAIPQFISLKYVSQMFDPQFGFFNKIIELFGGKPLDFFGDQYHPWRARITVILINIWIGIPYLMLVTTGILMNIPADLYESANIDGATKWQQYTKITLPYMLFVTGPYLLTSFTGNMNNFNVIYLLTGGGPTVATMENAGKTDLLITWLYNLAINKSDYKFAAVVGILVFVVVAGISLIVYNIIPSTKNEEAFQ